MDTVLDIEKQKIRQNPTEDGGLLLDTDLVEEIPGTASRASLLAEAKNVEDPVQQYLFEAGRTPLLTAEQEKSLARQIEMGNHLAKLERDWEAKQRSKPTGSDILLLLAERLGKSRSLFDRLCQYLEIMPSWPLAKKMGNADLRHAINGMIDPELVKEIARTDGASPSKTYSALIDLSLDSQLFPWGIVGGGNSSLAGLVKTLRSEPTRWLEKNSPEVEAHFAAVREAARSASNDLVQANLRLVISIAKKYIRSGLPLLDLVQEGNLGLLRAAQKFNHRLGYKLSTYAVWWIRQAISRYIAERSRTIHLPVYVVDSIGKLNRSRQRLLQENGHAPTKRELASAMGVSPEKVDSLVRASCMEPVSFETPVTEEDGCLADFIEDDVMPSLDDQAARALLKDHVRSMLESLSPRERRIVELRFDLTGTRALTLEEVGAEIGLTRERIRQIEREVLAKLRRPELARQFRDYLS